MKKIILLAVCLLSVSTAINAQETAKTSKTEKAGHAKMTSEQRAQRHVDDLNADVTLTEDQKKKVYELAMVKIKKVDEIKAKHAGQADADAVVKREVEPVKKEFRQSVKAILTAEQLEKFKAAKNNGKGKALDHD
ncbi:MAG: hypothetical protein V4677_12135 [Bacteroidota bacterium]